jgi:hypothetical protein
MNLSINKNRDRQTFDLNTLYDNLFPENGLLETTEQIRRFELLRLAFFVLKLRKLEQRIGSGQETAGREDMDGQRENDEQQFRRSLMRHVIFQQVLTLISLDAREQALQIIKACQK